MPTCSAASRGEACKPRRQGPSYNVGGAEDKAGECWVPFMAFLKPERIYHRSARKVERDFLKTLTDT